MKNTTKQSIILFLSLSMMCMGMKCTSSSSYMQEDADKKRGKEKKPQSSLNQSQYFMQRPNFTEKPAPVQRPIQTSSNIQYDDLIPESLGKKLKSSMQYAVAAAVAAPIFGLPAISTAAIVGGSKLYADTSKKMHEIKSFHISCKSDKPEELHGEEDLGGVVLYLYDRKEEWELNGINCRSGYIILKKIKNLESILSEKGQIHGRVYKSVFGEDPGGKVVGSGFSYKDGEWKFNSQSFNSVKDGYHSSDKGMNKTEAEWIMKAVENWIERDQLDTHVRAYKPLVISSSPYDNCCIQ